MPASRRRVVRARRPGKHHGRNRKEAPDALQCVDSSGRSAWRCPSSWDLCSSIPSLASAQAVTGTLLGNVTDSSGAAVPGATVTATRNADQHQPDAPSPTRPATTSSRACRTAPTRSRPSCRASRRSCGRTSSVDVNTTMRVDLKLEVGQLTETVTVSAETPLLQTDRTDTGRIIESKMVAELPLTFNRNFQRCCHRAGRDAAAPRALAVLQLAGLAARSRSTASRAWRTTR